MGRGERSYGWGIDADGEETGVYWEPLFRGAADAVLWVCQCGCVVDEDGGGDTEGGGGGDVDFDIHMIDNRQYVYNGSYRHKRSGC